jgi:hypothetical protein
MCCVFHKAYALGLSKAIQRPCRISSGFSALKTGAEGFHTATAPKDA